MANKTKILILTHPKLGEVRRIEVKSGYYEWVILKKWKATYGKKFNECSVSYELEGEIMKKDFKRRIVNIQTGDTYDSQLEAANALGVAQGTINSHVNRTLSDKFINYLVRYE